MRVLLIEPGREPRTVEVDGSNESLQKLVDSTIYRAIFPFEDPVVLGCDEEAEFHPYQKPNRVVKMKRIGNHVILGPFFLCGIESNNLTDLSDTYVEKYKKLFQKPDCFIRTKDGRLGVLRLPI